MRQGLGKQVYGDGSLYAGQWLDDMRDGYGKLSFQNGDVFEG